VARNDTVGRRGSLRQHQTTRRCPELDALHGCIRIAGLHRGLCARLGLQLLIVTPLQKVHVIEPYVRAIGFVDNPTSSYSRLQTLTIEEFRRHQVGREA
jgi:hypothetical protein